MVNADTPCEHGRTVRRATGISAIVFTLAACSSGGGRDLATYYDPAGLFRADLPAANSISVTPPQDAGAGPGLLTGVVASPPQPSPSPSAGLSSGGLFSGTEPQGDLTTYEAFAFTTDSFDDLDAMTLFFLTGDPAVDVVEESAVRLADAPARLVVADISRGGQLSASIAAALTLGSDGTGYLVAAIFPPGRWGAERADFLEVLSSFRPTIPPTMQTYPLQPEGA
jgi:hypothetical protein